MNARLVQLLQAAFGTIQEQGLVPPDTAPEIQVERPREEGHGDFATNLAMRLAKPAGKPPREVAEALVQALPETDALARVEIAGPGFINFHLAESVFQGVVPEVLRAGADYGKSRAGGGERVQVEFVSANPTGPLHVGHGRGAAYGDALARVLDAAGFRVEREYYVNDAGRQMNILAASVMNRYRDLVQGTEGPFPEKGYQGPYIRDIAAEVRTEFGDALDCGFVYADQEGDPEKAMDRHIADIRERIGEEAFRAVTRRALDHILGEIRADLDAFGVRFDTWAHEQEVVDQQAVEKALAHLRENGHLYEADGATWFRSSEFGDEKDRVVIRADGVATYFANDIGYHWSKYTRGYDHLIDIWGADHHGYVPRVKAAMQALGLDPAGLEIQLVQFANLFRNGEKVAMSTRSGQYVTLRELVDEVGRDAARFIYVLRRSDQHMDFDLEVAKQETEDNPVYYIHYAHVRIQSIRAKLEAAGAPAPEAGELAEADVSLLAEEKEGRLLRRLQRFPETVEAAALGREPHRVARFLQEVAAEFHTFYNSHRVLVDDPALLRARLALVEAVRRVLGNGLHMLGVEAPDRM
ncbi:arginine--tRNA ligase [Thiohalorhabdus methylotrophus]|uniref:Arginine--tRNA ligase n=1 Tax=Thiohalorhabdus methylotrophus TaxID=3242694 RepID=A0ABV4TW07_9GAMM